jgi:hypothetical protein
MVRTQARSAVDLGVQGRCKCGGRCSHCAPPAGAGRARLTASAAFAPPSARSARPGFEFASLPIHASGLAGGRSLQSARPMATPRMIARESAGPGGFAPAGVSTASGLSAVGPASARTANAGFPFASVPIHPPGLAGEQTLEAAPPETAPPASHGIDGRGEVASGISSGIGARGGAWMTEPSDPAEQEASHVAEQLFPSAPYMTSVVEASTGPASDDAELPARQEPTSTTGSCPTCGTVGKALGGHADSGTPLPTETRAEMESAFGADFSAVRIHTNSSAAQLSRNLKARAFTYGNEIFFDHGQYDPSTALGKRLLAHELTHTIQQRDAIASLARDGESPSTLKCVNDNLSAAGVASWLIGIIGAACGLLFGLAGSPTGPGAAGTAAFGAALCIAGVTGFAVGAVLGVISGCWKDPNFKSRGAYLSANTPEAGGAAGGAAPGGAAPGGAAPAPTAAA